MPEDFSGAYLDPGIFLEEITSPVVSTVGIAPTVACLVGDSQRYRTNVEIIQLTSTTAVQLSQLGINTATIVVKDRYTGTTYTVTTDYVATAGTGADASAGTLDDTTTIARSGGSTIPTGTYVTVSYQYTDPTYYQLQHFNDYDDIRDLYGDPFTSAGVINSPITLAAYMAFVNGASEIFTLSVRAAGATPTSNEWATALAVLRDEPRINVVVPVSGSTTIHDLVKAHVDYMANLGQYRRGIVGYDTTVAASAIKTAAQGYASVRMVTVGPSQYDFYEGNTNSVLTLPGQYAAAAVAGLHSSLAPEEPLTRKQIRGFFGISNQVTDASMVDYQRAGVLWLWKRRNDRILIRHAVTTNVSNIYNRELSIQAAKDRLQTLVLETFEAQNLIGTVITEQTPGIVIGAVRTALEQAKGRRMIQSYSGVKYRNPTDNPTLVQVRFMYKPSMPLNYIQIQFALDTNTGSNSFVELSSPAA